MLSSLERRVYDETRSCVHYLEESHKHDSPLRKFDKTFKDASISPVTINTD